MTATFPKHIDCFGFTEEEVFAALDEFGMSDRKQEVKGWYDGFTFGSRKDIYNRRYDIMLEPLHPDRDYGMIIKFKVFQPRRKRIWKIRQRWPLNRLGKNRRGDR